MPRQDLQILVQFLLFLLSDQRQLAKVDAVASLDEAPSVLLQACCSEQFVSRNGIIVLSVEEVKH
jgi:hypothetical protein